MKIKVEDLTSPVEFTIAGTEDWLTAIYETFPTPKGFDAPRIQGRLTVTPDNYGNYQVEGSLNFAPYLDCSRCDAKIVWPLAQDFRVTYRREESDELAKKERDLQREELDFYFYEKGEIDLEELVNEQIQIAIPLQTIRRDEHEQCLVCHRDLRQGLAYGSETPVRENPFHVLKKLKLDEGN